MSFPRRLLPCAAAALLLAAPAWALDPGWTDLRDGLAGTNGVPVLVGTGLPLGGETITLTLSDALESSSAFLVVGFSSISAPFKGGTMVPAPDLILGPFSTGLLGSVELIAPLPGALPPTFTLYYQYWIVDGAGPAGFAASNAVSSTGVGSGSVTVSVSFDDDNDVTTAPVGAFAAEVMIFGTDPLSSLGRSQVCNGLGLTTFATIDGPFTVTAQIDRTLTGGVTARLATTVIDVAPASGTIGVPISVGEGYSEPVTVDATLSGTISSLPVLGASEFLAVQVRARAGNAPWEGSALVDSGTGAYSLSVPSGLLLDLRLIHGFEPPAGLDDHIVLAGLISLGHGPVLPAGTGIADLDYASGDRFDFGSTVSTSYSGTLGAPDSQGLFFSAVDDSLGIKLGFQIFGDLTGSTSLPASVLLPDVTDGAFAGFDTVVGGTMFVSSGGVFSSLTCADVLGSTPGAQLLDFTSAPTISAPLPGAVLGVAAAEAMAVSYAPGSGGPGSGFDLLLFRADGTTAIGKDLVHWELWREVGSTGLTLPGTELSMFGDGASHSLKLKQFRFDGPAIDFDTFLDEDVVANITALKGLDATSAEANLGLTVSGP